MTERIQIGLITDEPGMIHEDIYKSLNGKFTVTKVRVADNKIPPCDLYVLASDRSDRTIVSQIRSKIAKSYDLVFVSSKQAGLEVDPENKVFMYPYKYEIITNLPLILHTLYNANKLRG